MKRILALAGAALVLGGIIAPAASTVTASPAQAASCRQVWTGKYKQLNTVHCWFTPSNPSCIVKVYRTECGGKF